MKAYNMGDNIILEKDGVKLMLTISEVSQLQYFVDREVHFREDVMTYLNEKVDSGELEKEVLEERDGIEALLDAYTENRQEHGSGSGCDDVLDWRTSLDVAYESWKN